MSRQYRLTAEQIQDLAIGHGGCLATDRITAEGRSGKSWCVDVNTIADYDRSIMEFLGAPIGSAFEKTPASEVFVLVDESYSTED